MERGLFLFALLLTLLLPLAASAAPVPPPAPPPPAPPPSRHYVGLESFLNQTILDVEIRGPDWAKEFGRNLPIHKGMQLNRDRLKRAVLHFYQNRITDLAAVRAAAEHIENGPRKGIRLIFVVEAVRKITQIEFEDDRQMDQGSLHRARLQIGGDFWPDAIDKSARQVAMLFLRAGWRDTEVEWWATKYGEGAGITFIVHRSDPTTLVQLEFPGDRRLAVEELRDVFPIKPGDQLNMEQVDEGIIELKALLRSHHYYRAEVALPKVEAGFNNEAIVTIAVNAGPRIEIRVSGNHTIDDETLIDHLHYVGDEPLDPSTEHDLAERIRTLYELAGHPYAKVDVRESAAKPGPPQVYVKNPGAPPPPLAPPKFRDETRPDYKRIGGTQQLSLDSDVPRDPVRPVTPDSWGVAPETVGTYHPSASRLITVDHDLPELDLPPKNRVSVIQRPGDVPIGGPQQFSIVPDVPIGPPLPSSTVTFEVTEGPAIRVVNKHVRGDLLEKYPEGDLKRRLDLALEDAVPDDLVNKLDASWMRAAQLGGAPGEIVPGPRVQPHEVFSKTGYKNGCEQIANLYRALGYLDVDVTSELVPQEGDNAVVVVTIVKKQQSIVYSVPLVAGVRDMPAELVERAVTVHTSDPLSYAAIDDTEKAILDLYRSRGYLAATVVDEERPQTNDDHAFEVAFAVTEGPQVHVSGIEFVGARHTPHSLVEKAIMLHVGDEITPEKRRVSVQNLLNLGTFTSASVDPKSTTSPETPLVVKVIEKPSLSADAGGGISEVDGPRARAVFTAAHFLESTSSFNATAKINVPVFRICTYFPDGCAPGVAKPSDPVEWRGTIGMAFPYFGKADEPPLDQKVDLIAQNVLRPEYFLNKYSVLGTITGLPHWRWGSDVKNPDLLISTQFQAEIERDFFEQTNTNTALFNSSLADQAARRLPTGPTQLVSLRPQISVDWRKGFDRDNKPNKNNPSSGGLITLILDFSRSFDAVIPESVLQGTKVALISALVTAGGYIPIYRPRRVVLVLNGRAGEIFSEPWAEIIGTKAFFLGGTATLRGFAEDSLLPQDIRVADHAGVQACNQLASGVGCSQSTLNLLANSASIVNPGGTVVVAGRSELRFELTESLDGNVFVDAGNLWSDPKTVDLRQLRYATGFGVAYPLPIGPAAFDLGFNLAPDTLVGESVVQVHFALGI